MGFAPTWLRQVTPPPASQNHFNHWHCYGNVGGWLGACLSHAGIVSKRLKLFRPSGSHIILVFFVPWHRYQIPMKLSTAKGVVRLCVSNSANYSRHSWFQSLNCGSPIHVFSGSRCSFYGAAKSTFFDVFAFLQFLKVNEVFQLYCVYCVYTKFFKKLPD